MYAKCVLTNDKNKHWIPGAGVTGSFELHNVGTKLLSSERAPVLFAELSLQPKALSTLMMMPLAEEVWAAMTGPQDFKTSLGCTMRYMQLGSQTACLNQRK